MNYSDTHPPISNRISSINTVDFIREYGWYGTVLIIKNHVSSSIEVYCVRFEK